MIEYLLVGILVGSFIERAIKWLNSTEFFDD